MVLKISLMEKWGGIKIVKGENSSFHNNYNIKLDVIISKIYHENKKLFKYLFVGILTTSIDMSIYFLLLTNTSLEYLYANIISFNLCLLISFILNRTFTFKSSNNKAHFQFTSFVFVAYTQLILVQIILFVIVDLIFKNDAVLYAMVAKVIAMTIGFIYAFTLNNNLTFKIFK